MSKRTVLVLSFLLLSSAVNGYSGQWQTYYGGWAGESWVSNNPDFQVGGYTVVIDWIFGPYESDAQAYANGCDQGYGLERYAYGQARWQIQAESYEMADAWAQGYSSTGSANATFAWSWSFWPTASGWLTGYAACAYGSVSAWGADYGVEW